MSWEPADPARAQARVVEIGTVVGDSLVEITDMLHGELVMRILELQGDALLVELLRASVRSNIETLAHVVRYDVAVEDVATPFGAREYARRLAQHGISPTALIRAYRLGQHVFLEWAVAQLAELEDDPAVAYAAAQRLMGTTFRYIDSISEQVVHDYEAERERWLALRSTVRAEAVQRLLSGERLDVAAAESALGHRLGQYHLGAVLWAAGDHDPELLAEMQRVAGHVARAMGLAAPPLFHPRDRACGFVWLPLGAAAGVAPDPAGDRDFGDLWRAALADSGADLRVAVGSAHPGPAGFASTHEEALRAREVALVAGPGGPAVLGFAEAGVRTAALLAADLPGTRRLVARSLGALACDDDASARLRETMEVLLREKGSYVAAAETLSMHKNTVKYRVDKAVSLRGRPLDEDRLELELALLACSWLGPAVLVPGA